MGKKRELVALLGLSSWCLVVVVWLFLAAMLWVSLQFVIVIFPDHTHLLFLINKLYLVSLSVCCYCCFALSRVEKFVYVSSEISGKTPQL